MGDVTGLAPLTQQGALHHIRRHVDTAVEMIEKVVSVVQVAVPFLIPVCIVVTGAYALEPCTGIQN